jgi:hypothetical protein
VRTTSSLIPVGGSSDSKNFTKSWHWRFWDFEIFQKTRTGGSMISKHKKQRDHRLVTKSKNRTTLV